MWVQFLFVVAGLLTCPFFIALPVALLYAPVVNATETIQWTYSSGNCSGFTPDSLFNPEHSGYQNSGKDKKVLFEKLKKIFVYQIPGTSICLSLI